MTFTKELRNSTLTIYSDESVLATVSNVTEKNANETANEILHNLGLISSSYFTEERT